MTVEIKGVHYDVSDGTREHINGRMNRLKHKDYIVDFHLTITKETKGYYTVSSDAHLCWGAACHVRIEDKELFKAIDRTFDKLETQLTKEKGKVQDHHGGTHHNLED